MLTHESRQLPSWLIFDVGQKTPLMTTPSASEEKRIASEAYDFFSDTVEKDPTDAHIRQLRQMIAQVLSMSASAEVRSHAKLAISSLDHAAKFKKHERRIEEMPRVAHSMYRVAHTER